METLSGFSFLTSHTALEVKKENPETKKTQRQRKARDKEKPEIQHLQAQKEFSYHAKNQVLQLVLETRPLDQEGAQKPSEFFFTYIESQVARFFWYSKRHFSFLNLPPV